MGTPFWQSKAFWSLVITQVISAATFFGGRYLAPEDFEIVVFLTATFESVGLFFVAHYFTADVQGQLASVRSDVRGNMHLMTGMLESFTKGQGRGE